MAYLRWLVLSTIDREWREYLQEVEDLKQGIGLEAFGQRDPRVELRRKAFDLFDELRAGVRRSIVSTFFVTLPSYQQFLNQQRQAAALREQKAKENYRVDVVRSSRKEAAGAGTSTSVTIRRDVAKVGRNDPCPCGSGKKYKHCHGMLERQPVAVGANGGGGGQTKAKSGKKGHRR
jgi:preprotein translocase subunit SecA